MQMYSYIIAFNTSLHFYKSEAIFLCEKSVESMSTRSFKSAPVKDIHFIWLAFGKKPLSPFFCLQRRSTMNILKLVNIFLAGVTSIAIS